MQQTTIISFRDVERCPICDHGFQRILKKAPRILYCNHCICSQCIATQVETKKFLQCPVCKQRFSKTDCTKFTINYLFLDMMDHLQKKFEHIFIQVQGSDENRQKKNQINDHEGEFKKCRNSECFNQTEFNFCSEECQFQFEEVETKKNQGRFMHRNSGGSNDLFGI